MKAEDLLHSLKSSGIELWAAGVLLKWRALKPRRRFGVELSSEYHKIAKRRIDHAVRKDAA